MVPNDWEIKKLDEIARVTSGGTPSRSKAEYWQNGTIPWVTTSEVQFNTITESAEYITLEGLNNSSAKLFEPNTLLIAMYGQGKTRGQVAKLGIRACTNQACAAIILNDNNDSNFFFYYLSNLYESLRDLSNDGSQKNLSSGIIKSLFVHIPPIEEQHKIAEILSTWDKAIASTENLIANSEMQKKALMQQLLTGKKRLLDENGVRFSGEWKKATLGTITNIQKGRALSSKNLIDGSYPVIAGGKTSPYNHRDYTHENIITVSASGAYAGYVAYHNYKIWASDCSVISNKESTSILYVYQLLSLLQQKIYSLQSGGAQPHIYPKDLNGLVIGFPTQLLEQEKIAEVLSNADREIELLKAKLEHLKQEKKALMQQLLTGKRRVVIN